jgi:nucleotidyltransferase/DNA polymerase involved in DNA repair
MTSAATPSRRILHVDMDAFYAAVEQRDRPELRGKPVIVGADPQNGRGRGVVATASYEARRFGVGSAMPISQAWRACPHGIYVRPDMAKYAAVSSQVFEVLRRFTDQVEPVSIDEAFLDVTTALRAIGPGGVAPAGTAEALARRLKAAVAAETGLTASVGLATSKMVAKVASDMRKPDGLVVVAPGEEAAFLAPLPVRRLWGVGPKMEESLLRAGIHTIGDLARAETAGLERRLGAHAGFLQELARGIDVRPVVADAEDARSLGHEHTFDVDTAERETLRRTLLEICDAVARRVREHGWKARTVTLKYRDERFFTVTRARTIEEATDSGDALFAVAWRLFEGVHGAGPERGRQLKVRLLGIYASGFGPSQLGLFGPATSVERDRVRDAVDERFGEGALTRASLLPRPASRGCETTPPGPAGDRSRRLKR